MRWLASNFWHTLKNFKDYSGRSSKKQFWSFVGAYSGLQFINTFYAIYLILYSETGSLQPSKYPFLALFIITILPAFALYVRRLHDIGKSAWWLIAPWFPIYFLFSGEEGDNEYGAAPNNEI